jgi:molybdenum cofactor synthesis domain-containing protein
VIRVAILTISDSASTGTRTDLSGPALQTLCGELGWPVMASAIVPDEEAKISEILRDWADHDVASFIVTTGGTGVSARDVTPEATRAVLDRELPGIAEFMRAKGMEQTEFSILSRAAAGTRKHALIVNLPGSPKGALYSLRLIHSIVGHVVDLLAGQTQHEPE